VSYHKYVFDVENRKFIGEFEKMYQNEDVEGFDSWNEYSIVENLKSDLMLAILQKYGPYDSMLDIGCGKGALSNRIHPLGKKHVAYDISPTAISKARQKYRDIDFRVGDVAEIKLPANTFSLVTAIEILWYVIPRIHQVLEKLKRTLKTEGYFFTSLFIPDNPIGKEVIPDGEEFVSIIAQHFKIKEIIHYQRESDIINNSGHTLVIAQK
jgi:ubiquinone/menaquinone biosynthesis C-methylase UbiE